MAISKNSSLRECSLPISDFCQCKPAKAISIIEADVNVDFAPPKDYKVRSMKLVLMDPEVRKVTIKH